MRIEDLDFPLPERLIAQHPAARRDAARLLVLEKATKALRHLSFADLPDLLRPGDLLVMNDTRVIPARLVGTRLRTGGKWEGLYLRTLADGCWEMLCQTRGRLEIGEVVAVDTLRLTLTGRNEGHWLARPETPGDAVTLLGQHGQIPLPPYIRKGRAEDADRERYQTVYADRAGSVAAPTAGLHFTPELLARLAERGIGQAFVTLHVGMGTFQPIKGDDINAHVMHYETGELPAATVEAIARCQAGGGRVIAVGTTTVRVLETAALSALPPAPLVLRGRGDGGEGAALEETGPSSKAAEPLTPIPSPLSTGERGVRAWRGETNLFIRPPYDFRAIDGLITNFHLPRSTLLLLVGAFVGLDTLLRAYHCAVVNDYRFFSYGDAMLIL